MKLMKKYPHPVMLKIHLVVSKMFLLMVINITQSLLFTIASLILRNLQMGGDIQRDFPANQWCLEFATQKHTSQNIESISILHNEDVIICPSFDDGQKVETHVHESLHKDTLLPFVLVKEATILNHFEDHTLDKEGHSSLLLFIEFYCISFIGGSHEHKFLN